MVILFFGYHVLSLNSLSILFWCSFLILIQLFEFKNSVNPLIRLTAIVFHNILILNLPALPQFNFGFLNILFNNHLFQIIFTLAMATIINGQNIIDGTMDFQWLHFQFLEYFILRYLFK